MSGALGRAALAAGVALAHFALTALALRALVGGMAGAHAPPAWSALAVAVLGAPLFYTPLRDVLAGAAAQGWAVAALNSLLWGALVLALLAWRARRRYS